MYPSRNRRGQDKRDRQDGSFHDETAKLAAIEGGSGYGDRGQDAGHLAEHLYTRFLDVD